MTLAESVRRVGLPFVRRQDWPAVAAAVEEVTADHPDEAVAVQVGLDRPLTVTVGDPCRLVFRLPVVARREHHRR